MATFLDTALIDKVSVIFTWLLVFVLVFGMAEVTNLLKNRALNALLALSIAVLVGFSPSITAIISGFAPWFIVIAFLILFLLLLSNFMGIPTANIVETLGGKNASWWLLVPLFVALTAALSGAIGQSLLEERTGTQTITTADGETITLQETPHRESVVLTLTNPKVLGLILILLIAMFTIIFLAGGPSMLK
jgi:hypothetical protein